MSPETITRIADLPSANYTIGLHWRNDNSALCPWSRTRVNRLITTCPNGCGAAAVTKDEPGIGIIDVTDAVAAALNLDTVSQMLGLYQTGNGDWMDKVTIQGHRSQSNILILNIIENGREFTITINETV